MRFITDPPAEGGAGNDPGGEGAGSAFEPPKSQADLDAILARKVAEAVEPFADYQSLKAEVEQLRARPKVEPQGDGEGGEEPDPVNTADAERAQKAETELANLKRELTTERVKAAFQQAATGRTLKPDALFNFDATKFVDENGAVNQDEVTKWVEEHSSRRGLSQIPGQGAPGNSNSGSLDAGRELYEQIHKKRKG